MKITICGSMHHEEAMFEASKALIKMGYDVETPDINEQGDDTPPPTNDQALIREGLIKQHLDKITSSDAILVFNKEKNGVAGYVGGSTLMEMAFAYAQGIEIFLLNPAPDISYKDEIEGMLPIVLDGKIEEIKRYFDSLPKTFVSSKSPVKLTAVSRAMRRAGIRTQVIAKPTESGVSEQPADVNETYKGAHNRQNALRKAVTDESAPYYLATVESGLFHVHADHNVFSSTIVVLEKSGDQPKTGVNVELEYPRSMTDKVPSIYPDLGVLVQQEYGSALKDPFPFFTDGKINRQKLVEDAVFNVAAQLIE